MDHEELYRKIRAGIIKSHNYSPDVVRFWSRVNKNGPIHPVVGQCWVWTGVRFASGYGRFEVKGRPKYIHRWCWELFYGDIPEGMQILHQCDRPICLNPKHLFLGTHQDNIDDKVSKGRQTKGRHVNTVKLTEEQVIQIRKMYKKGVTGYRLLGMKFGVETSTVWAIVTGKSWKHLL